VFPIIPGIESEFRNYLFGSKSKECKDWFTGWVFFFIPRQLPFLSQIFPNLVKQCQPRGDASPMAESFSRILCSPQEITSVIENSSYGKLVPLLGEQGESRVCPSQDSSSALSALASPRSHSTAMSDATQHIKSLSRRKMQDF
jgi:hypothetical protein